MSSRGEEDEPADAWGPPRFFYGATGPPPPSFACLDLGDGRMIKTEVLYDAPQARLRRFECEPFDRRPTPVGPPRPDRPPPPQPPHPPHPPHPQSRPPLDCVGDVYAAYDAFGRGWGGEPPYDPFGRGFRPFAPAMRPPETPFYEPPQPVRVPVSVPIPVSAPVPAPAPTPVEPKRRIVAEVKPMRPSYSDVLAKAPKPDGEGPTDRPAPKQETGSERSRGRDAERPQPSETRSAKAEPARRRAPRSPRSSASDAGEAGAKGRRSVVEEPEKEPAPRIQRTEEVRPRTRTAAAPQTVRPRASKTDATEKNGTADDRASEDADVEREMADDDPDDRSEDDPRPEKKPDGDRAKKRNARHLGQRTNAKGTEKNKKTVPNKSKRHRGNDYIAFVRAHLDSWFAILIGATLWLFNLVADVCRMSAHLSVDLFSSAYADTRVRSRTVYEALKEKAVQSRWMCDIGSAIDNKYGHTSIGFWRKFKWFKKNVKAEPETDNFRKNHLNIPLPSTGDDAMKRLLACKGKDPYSILGVGVQCSDDDIKRYYRRQAFLVHPDKNQQPGAEEAFKILQHAFDMIGEPERREAYEQRVLESRHAEAARSELADLVAKLQEKVQRAASTIRCSGCSHRHPRTPTTRPCYAARYCSQCNIHHSAKEGDIWAESTCWGLKWMYYACMDGAVYQITQWASCQKKNLTHVKANTHHVQYRIVLGNKTQPGNGGKSPTNNIHDADLEDFLSNYYTKTSKQTPGTNPGKSTPNMPPSENAKKRKSKKAK